MSCLWPSRSCACCSDSCWCYCTCVGVCSDPRRGSTVEAAASTGYWLPALCRRREMYQADIAVRTANICRVQGGRGTAEVSYTVWNRCRQDAASNIGHQASAIDRGVAKVAPRRLLIRRLCVHAHTFTPNALLVGAHTRP